MENYIQITNMSNVLTPADLSSPDDARASAIFQNCMDNTRVKTWAEAMEEEEHFPSVYHNGNDHLPVENSPEEIKISSWEDLERIDPEAEVLSFLRMHDEELTAEVRFMALECLSRVHLKSALAQAEREAWLVLKASQITVGPKAIRDMSKEVVEMKKALADNNAQQRTLLTIIQNQTSEIQALKQSTKRYLEEMDIKIANLNKQPTVTRPPLAPALHQYSIPLDNGVIVMAKAGDKWSYELAREDPLNEEERRIAKLTKEMPLSSAQKLMRFKWGDISQCQSTEDLVRLVEV